MCVSLAAARCHVRRLFIGNSLEKKKKGTDAKSTICIFIFIYKHKCTQAPRCRFYGVSAAYTAHKPACVCTTLFGTLDKGTHSQSAAQSCL